MMAAARSGVYRTDHADTALQAARTGGLDIARIAAPGKSDVRLEIARALDFPGWFGGNWDALEDCLCDLSWRAADGYLLLFENVAPHGDFGVLTDVLASAAEYWAGRGKPFFAVFVDPQRKLPLQDLAATA